MHPRPGRRPAALLLVLILLCLAESAEAQHRRHTGPPSRRSVPASTSLAQAVNLLIANPAVNRAHWGVSVRTLDGQELFALNNGQYFQPASNAKLFTTAAAFALLPPNAMYVTNIVAEGTVDSAGTLHGALAILGAGDPTISGRTYPFAAHTERSLNPLAGLEDMADQIQRAGIHRIEGSVIGDDTFYPMERYGSGWASDDLLWLYGAPVSALTVNDNAVFLNVLQNGAPPPMSSTPVSPMNPNWRPATSYYTLQNDALFAPGGAPSHPGLDRQPGTLSVRLYGTLPADGYHAGLAIEDPAEYAARSLTEMLAARGIVVTGHASARHRVSNNTASFISERAQAVSLTHVSVTEMAAPTRGYRIVATHRSPPVSQDWTVTNKVSQNLHAELALRTMGKLYGTDGSFAQGTRVVRQFLESTGILPADFFFYDGCGLSTGDLITPRAATTLLAYASRQPWGADFRATLPIGGVDGSLAGRFSSPATRNHVFAKTGTLNETNALSGYVETASGKTLAFSVLVNDHSPDSNAQLATMDAIVEAIATRE